MWLSPDARINHRHCLLAHVYILIYLHVYRYLCQHPDIVVPSHILRCCSGIVPVTVGCFRLRVAGCTCGLDHGLIAAHTVVFLEDESIATVQWLLIHAHHTVIVLLFYSVSESAIDIVFESQASSIENTRTKKHCKN